MALPERVAVIYNQRPGRPGMGGNVVQALRGLGVHAEQFPPNREPDSWDRYFYVDKWSCVGRTLTQKHPSIFWALDMVVPQEYWRPSLKRYVEYARRADWVFAGCKTSADYLVSRGIEARWLPLAANPAYHRPWPEEERVYDVIALWHNCRNRIEHTKAIRQSGLKQFVGYEDGISYSQWMGRARCAVSLGRSNELSLRVFEVMAMGVPLITDRCRDLGLLFTEGEHYLGFSDVGEMLKQVAWVQGHSGQAQAMAERARKEVVNKHTFHHRVLTMLGE